MSELTIQELSSKLDSIIASIKPPRGRRDNGDVLNSRDIRARLGYSSSTFYARIPMLVKFGMWKDGHWRMYEDDIQKYIDSKKSYK